MVLRQITYSYLKFTSGFFNVLNHLIITTTYTSTSPQRSFIASTNDLLKEMKAQLKEGTWAWEFSEDNGKTCKTNKLTRPKEDQPWGMGWAGCTKQYYCDSVGLIIFWTAAAVLLVQESASKSMPSIIAGTVYICCCDSQSSQKRLKICEKLCCFIISAASTVTAGYPDTAHPCFAV